MATLKDIATRTETSIGTVSRVLSGRMGNLRISPARKQRICEVARELDYVPNLRAKSMVLKKSYVIGVICTSYHSWENSFERLFSDSYIFSILNSVTRVCRDHGYHCAYIVDKDCDLEKFKHPQAMRDGTIDGAVLVGYSSPEVLQKMASHNVPCVHIGSNVPSGASLDSVVTDLSQALTEVVDVCCQAGHRRMELFSPYGPGPERLAKKFCGLSDNYADVETLVYRSRNIVISAEEVRERLSGYLHEKNPPTVFISQELTCRYIAEFLEQSGREDLKNALVVPISSIVFEDYQLFRKKPAVQIILPLEKIAEMSARKLFSRLESSVDASKKIDYEEIAVPCSIVYGEVPSPVR